MRQTSGGAKEKLRRTLGEAKEKLKRRLSSFVHTLLCGINSADENNIIIIIGISFLRLASAGNGSLGGPLCAPCLGLLLASGHTKGDSLRPPASQPLGAGKLWPLASLAKVGQELLSICLFAGRFFGGNSSAFQPRKARLSLGRTGRTRPNSIDSNAPNWV